MLNPYQYMLDIRSNRILFQYLITSAVHFSDSTGWTIQGYSDYGKTEIYETAGGVIRITLPIPVPKFITKEVLYRVLHSLNGSIEGITTVAEEEGELFIEYHVHIGNIESKIDEALLKFIQEREEINQGFQSLEKDYNKIQEAVQSTMDNITASLSNMPKGLGAPSSNPEVTMEDLSKLWEDMDDIDKMEDDDEEDNTQGGAGNPGF